MKPLALFLLPLLAACLTAEAEVASSTDDTVGSEIEVEAGVPAALADQMLRTDWASLEDAEHNLELLRDDVRSMKRRDKARLRASLVELVVNCPYNRTAAQLPLLLKSELARRPDPELAELRAVVDVHVALLEDLGISELPLPREGDNLHGLSTGLHSRASLGVHASPVSQTQALADQIPGIVDAYSDETVARIDAANEVVAPALRTQWPLKGQLIAYRGDLERVRDASTDEFQRAELDALIDSLSAFMATGC